MHHTELGPEDDDYERTLLGRYSTAMMKKKKKRSGNQAGPATRAACFGIPALRLWRANRVKRERHSLAVRQQPNQWNWGNPAPPSPDQVHHQPRMRSDYSIDPGGIRRGRLQAEEPANS